jgi:hypothetical protein
MRCSRFALRYLNMAEPTENHSITGVRGTSTVEGLDGGAAVMAGNRSWRDLCLLGTLRPLAPEEFRASSS